MASQTFNNFKHYATLLEKELGIKYDTKPYKETIRTMLDGYCKAVDEDNDHEKNLYISGLILRFWDKVGKLASMCPNIGLKGEDFVDWVYEAIILACDYRKWQVDPNVNAQQCINQCIETVRVRHYYEYNLDKHKVNYNTISMSNTIGEQGDTDSLKTLEDTLYDEDEMKSVAQMDGTSEAKHLVQLFINRSRIVEAVIMDIIAFGETEKISRTTKKGVDDEGNEIKYNTYTAKFWKFKAVQILANLPEDYYDYFISNYVVNNNALLAALDALKKANNSKLYRELDKSLAYAKTLLTHGT